MQKKVVPNNIKEKGRFEQGPVFKQAPYTDRVNMLWPSPRLNCGEASHLK